MGLFSHFPGMGKPRIFVQIASYRDPECQWTVKDLFEQAAHPDRVFVGICWQFDKDADHDCFVEPSPRPKQTRVLEMKASDSEGPCWARHYAQTLYKDEDYVLMIDSHMRFVKGWDEILIAELARCPSKKALITHYPPGYEPPRKLNLNPKLSVMVPKKFNPQGCLRGDGISLEQVPDQPLRGAFIAAGFVFAKAELIVEVPYDPYMYFDQEEVSIALRMFTKGWDVYHPTKIVLYHYYKKAGDPSHRKLLHWENDKTWARFQQRGGKRFHHLVGHKASSEPDVIVEMDHYGLGTRRTVKDFETYVGVDFANLTVSEEAIKGRFVHDIEKWKFPAAPVAAAVPNPGDEDAAKKKYDSLSPLGLGHLLPPFVLPNYNGMPMEIQLYAGRKLLLFFLPVAFTDYLEHFFRAYTARRGELSDDEVKHLFIIKGTAEEAGQLAATYAVTPPVLYDTAGALHRAFGLGKEPRDTALTVLVNANQKILGLFRERNAENHMGDVIRGVEMQPSARTMAIATHIHPPVLMVPDVIPPDFCQELIDYWQKGKRYEGTIGVGKQIQVVLSGKRRVDVDVNERSLLKRLDDQVAKTMLPELRKVSAFEAIFRERYKIGRYGAEDDGYYNQHRDTGVKELAYRRYSMSLVIGGDYDGGLLHFPEYGTVHYKIPPGTAALFPSALLHGVTPVRRGERFVLVSFFHGPLEEAYRKRQITERGEKYNENDVHTMVESRYADLPQSQYLYTSSIVTRVIEDD